MNVSRRSFLSAAAGLLSALSALDRITPAAEGAGAPPPGVVTFPPLALRGYGTLFATHRALHDGQSSLTHVTCDSPQKAHLVQAKYLSDLGLLPGTQEGTLAVGGHSVPIRRTSTGGAVACYARGNDVLIFAAASEAQMKEVCTAALPPNFAAADFGAHGQVPTWLDRWDKHGLMSYYAPGQVPPNTPVNGYDPQVDLQFAKDNDLGYGALVYPAER